jgi:hypothetical protein
MVSSLTIVTATVSVFFAMRVLFGADWGWTPWVILTLLVLWMLAAVLVHRSLQTLRRWRAFAQQAVPAVREFMTIPGDNGETLPEAMRVLLRQLSTGATTGATTGVRLRITGPEPSPLLAFLTQQTLPAMLGLQAVLGTATAMGLTHHALTTLLEFHDGDGIGSTLEMLFPTGAVAPLDDTRREFVDVQALETWTPTRPGQPHSESPTPPGSPGGVQQFARTHARDVDACSICLESLTTAPSKVLMCRHALHKVCLEQMLLMGTAKCPLCRASLNAPRPTRQDLHGHLTVVSV